MTWKHYFTVLAVGGLAAAPGLLGILPGPYAPIAAGVIATAGALFHLFTPKPGA